MPRIICDIWYIKFAIYNIQFMIYQAENDETVNENVW